MGQNWFIRAGSLAARSIVFLPFFLSGAFAAQGAGAPVKAPKPPSVVAADLARTAGQDPQVTSSVEEADPGCLRARKRLWVEGEGWVVRRVTTCF